MLRRAKNSLFREPRQGMTDRAGAVLGWMGILGGFFSVIICLFFFDFSRYGGHSYGPVWVGLGLMLMLQGTAELLPRDQITLAGWLRVGAFLLALLSLIVAVAGLAIC